MRIQYALFGLVTLVTACTRPNPNAEDDDGTDTGGCVDGELGCSCLGDLTCDSDLVCSDAGICEESTAVCGDGLVEGAEQCDNGDGNGDDQACKSDCTEATCGDGFVGPGETCDDGNDENDDGCTVECLEPACGDGFLQEGEACDDANDSNDDGCVEGCVLAACGDGFVYDGVEDCDDQNDESRDACSNTCFFTAFPTCGNGVDDPGEICFESGQPFDAVGSGLEPIIFAHDVNDDGNVDLIYAQDSTSLWFAIGNGDGTFQGSLAIDDPPVPITAYVVGHLDEDDHPDIVVAGNDGRLYPAWGDPDQPTNFGVFNLPLSPVTSSTIRYLAIQEVSGDGFNDVLWWAQDEVSVWRQTGSRIFAAATPYAQGESFPFLAGVDLDGDGVRTLAVLEAFPTAMVGLSAAPPEELSLSFVEPDIPPNQDFSLAWLGADLLGDGAEEFIVAGLSADACLTFEEQDCSRPSITIYGGTGEEELDPQPISILPDPGLGPVGLRAVDQDGDDDLDLLVYDDSIQHVHVYRNLGEGQFSSPLLFPVTATGEVPRPALADFNGDGRDDVALLDPDGKVRFLLSTN